MMDQASIYHLSENHPLIADPDKPWPWKVLVGYRARGNRKLVATRSIYVRASGHQRAEAGAIREARQMVPMVKDGANLVCSRIVSSRPLDKHDTVRLG